jgi:hypothetical protein
MAHSPTKHEVKASLSAIKPVPTPVVLLRLYAQ